MAAGQDEPGPPAWAEAALAVAPVHGATQVEGVAVTHRSWGAPGAPGVVLVHGGAAHAGWWDHVGPLLAQDHHVVAVDLSGHGDSGRRDAYPPSTWADEVLEVAADLGMDRPVVVGHSMGGFVTLLAATRPGRLGGAVVVDSPVRRPDPEWREAREGGPLSSPKTYATLDDALDHFFLVPPQPHPPAWLHRRVGAASLREVDGRWAWKWDPRIFGDFSTEDPRYTVALSEVACPIAVLHGERSSIVTAQVLAWMREHLPADVPFVEVPDAHHHLLLDQPLAFVTALRTLLTVRRSLGAR